MISFDEMTVLRYKEIDSTNTEARRLIDEGKLTGPTVLVADHQTAGRGRQGRSFYSPASSGLYMTVVLTSEYFPSVVTMTTRAACAVAQAVEQVCGIAPGIKWVNDLYLAGRKICGILCEAVNDPDTFELKYVIVGVGINLTTDLFPDELRDIAGSVFGAETGVQDPDIIREKLLRSVSERLTDLSDCDFPDYYRKHSIVIGRDITYVENGVTYAAHALDIDDDGGLMVTDSDRVRVLSSGEISIKV